MSGEEDISSGLTQEQIDYLSIMHDVPVAKLNADMYAADDIDGVTEGASGSGNLNFLVLQSSQTNEAQQINNPFDIENDNGDLGPVGGMAGGALAATVNGVGGAGSIHALVNDTDSPSFRSSLDSHDGQDGDIGGGGGGHNGGVAPITALSFSATSDRSFYDSLTNNNNFPGNDGQDGLSGSDGLSGNDGTSGTSGNDGLSGLDGDPGTDGGPGDPGPPGPPGPPNPPDPGTPDTDLTLDLDTGILDSDYDINLDQLEAILGDLDIDIDGVLNDILGGGLLGGSGLGVDIDHLGNGLLDLDSDSLIGDTVTAAEDLVNGITDGLPPQITDLLTNPTGILDDLLGMNGDGDTDLTIDLLPNLPIDLHILDGLHLDIPLDPVEALVGDLDINVTAALADILRGDILQDTDLLLSAFHNGDDLLSLAASDIVGSTADLAEGLTGGMIDSILNGPGTGDTDLTVGILSDLGFMGGGISTIHVPLDVVEELVGDIDIDIDNLLSLDTILDADGLTNGDLPVLDTALSVGTDILPDLATGLATDDLAGSIGDILDELASFGGDIDPDSILSGLGENLADGLQNEIGDITNFAGDVLDAPTGGLADGLIDDGIASVVDGALGELQPVLEAVTDVLGGDTGFDDLNDAVGDLFGGIGNGGDLGGVADTVEDLLGNGGDLGGVTDTVEDLLGSGGDLGGVTDTVEDLLGNGGDLGGVTDTVEDLLGGAGDIGDLGDVTDALGGLLGGSSDGDTDLSIDTGISIGDIDIEDIDIDLPLDPVESIVGDIDIDVDAGATVGDVVQDIASGDIGDVVDDVAAAVGLDMELDILDPLLGEDGLDITETVGGGDLLDDLLGGDALDWPEASIADGVGDVVGGLLGDAAGGLDLPEPEGVLADGLGSILDDGLSHAGLGGLGGLFG